MSGGVELLSHVTRDANPVILTSLERYTLAASTCLLAYDYLVTLNQEVTFVWPAGLSIGTVLFYLNRYLPFIDTCMSLHVVVAKITPNACEKEVKVFTWFIVIGAVISEVILGLRTAALWERSRWILISLTLALSSLMAIAAAATHYELKSIHYGPGPNSVLGCYFASDPSRIIFLAWVMLLAGETYIVVLTMIRAFYHLRRSQASWITKLYQDGFLFYLYLLGLTIANVLVPAIGPPALTNWLAAPHRVIHSVLCNRVMFFVLSRRTRAEEPQKESMVFTTVFRAISDSHNDMTFVSEGNIALHDLYTP